MSIKKLSARFFVFSLFLVLSLSGCTSQRVIDADAEIILYPQETYIPESFDWQQVQPGIDRFDFSNPDFPIIYHAVRIDLTTPGLELVCVPTAPEGFGGADASGTSPTSSATGTMVQTGRSRRQATSSFAAEQNCIVAINATQFDFSSIVGIHKVNGIVISAPIEKYAALAFRRELACPAPAAPQADTSFGGTDGAGTSDAGGETDSSAENNAQNAGYSAKIFAAQTVPQLAEYDFAFGGFFVVLENGEVCYDFIRRHTSRTGAGLSPDGRTLYILVAEGERPLKSEGLSYPQCGEIFKAMGCTNALEFDGGDSTELCINGKSVLSYKVHRTQATSFGFRRVQE